MQLRFSKTFWFQLLTLWAAIAGAQLLLRPAAIPQRLGPRAARINFQPVALGADAFAPLRLSGAWVLTSNDPRFGGISALAVDGQALVALSDAGVVIRFAKPGSGPAQAQIAGLPRGPGKRASKYNRDSESVLRDPQGRGWWVGFENRNQLWLYDPTFTHAIRRVAFGKDRWPENKGLEGLAAEGRGVLLFPEAGDAVVRWADGRVWSRFVQGGHGRISDAARLPDGRLLVLHRHWSLLGFSSAITLMRPTRGGGLVAVRSWPIRTSALDNFEAMAAERVAGGGTRLWLMTDDNQQRPLRTLLVALNVPKDVGG